MIAPELANFALMLALGFALCGAILPLLGIFFQRDRLVERTRFFTYCQSGFIVFAYLLLSYAFVSDDFSVLYVARHSSLQLPLWYKLTAVWGGHEGSMLLWLTVLALWMVAVARFSRSLPEATVARVLAVLAWVSCGFLLFIITTSNPFLRLLDPIPKNGMDLNPLLQDPGFLFHPPMLYMGYVGFSVAFAFAIASLMAGRLDAQWAKWSRPWTLAAWCFLTTGITLGSWWAYRELGWGGWWFWDPVENASFLPWLVGTALLHSLAVTEKRNTFKAWTVLLAICAFSLSLLGTFLVRSGVLTSVHAFAVDPSRGAFMLGFLFIVITSSLALYAWRMPSIAHQGQFQLVSRESFLLLNNVILFVVMLTVLLGTLYPLFFDALGYGKISVGAPYFNAVFIPLMIPLFMLMGIGPNTHWQSMPIQRLRKNLWWCLLFSVVLAVALPLIFTQRITIGVCIGLGLSLWICTTSLRVLLNNKVKLTRAKLGMICAHLGIAASILGITLSSAYSVERNVRMDLQDLVTVGPYSFRYINSKQTIGPNYTSAVAVFSVRQGEGPYFYMRPEKRIYQVQKTAMTDSAIDAGITRDLYIALGNPIGANGWTVRIYYKPFMRWLWAGGFLMLCGGLLALSDRRYRRRSHVPLAGQPLFNEA